MKLKRILFRSDMQRYAICTDAPCAAACGKLDCAGALRSILLDIEDAAAW